MNRDIGPSSAPSANPSLGTSARLTNASNSYLDEEDVGVEEKSLKNDELAATGSDNEEAIEADSGDELDDGGTSEKWISALYQGTFSLMALLVLRLHY
jgi:hypothetical protein